MLSTDEKKIQLKTKLNQLEWLIICMAATVLAALQILHYVLLDAGYTITLVQTVLDFIFVMAIIFGLVHFSFIQMWKIQDDLIDKKEQAEQAERRMKHIIDTSVDAIFTLDHKYGFLFANRSTEKVMGFDSSQILNKNFFDMIAPEYRNTLLSLVGDPQREGHRYIYIDIVHGDGKTVPVELSLTPITDYASSEIHYQCVARDITERKAVEMAQRDKENCLQAVSMIGQLILEAKDEMPYDEILDMLCKASGSRKAFVTLNDNAFSSFSSSSDHINMFSKREGEYDVPENQAGTRNSGNGDGYCTKQVITKNGNETKSYFVKDDSLNAIIGTDPDDKLSITLPLNVDSKFAGVMGFENPGMSSSWNTMHINLLTPTVNMLAQSIERKKANEQIKHHFISLAKILSRTLFFVDPFTASHQQRLAEMVCVVGQRMDLAPKQIEWLYFCALLHDIGKAAIPSTILSKPGKLTDEEWTLMRSHVTRSQEMIKVMDLPDSINEIIVNHHERIDGSGYPKGIAGERLSLEARILSACDVVEAMSSHRPYRPAISKEKILEELQTGKGSKYDSRVAGLLAKMLENGEIV